MVKYLLPVCAFILTFLNCGGKVITDDYVWPIMMEDTLFLKGKLIHHKHINADSGVYIVDIDTCNVLNYNGIYGDVRDGSGFGLITPDTAFVLAGGYHDIARYSHVSFQQGHWRLSSFNDSLPLYAVNNIVGTFDKSAKYISNFRGDGVLKHHYHLRPYIFLAWFPGVMFVLYAIAFKILKVKV